MPKNLRHSNPYRVPDGYFADLRNGLRERIAAETSSDAAGEQGIWQRIRGIVGFSAAFGCLVLLAAVGYYFTGYEARQRELLAMQDETAEIFTQYRVYSDDIEALDEYLSDDPEVQTENRVQFAEAVAEYLDTYGYGGADWMAALTGLDTY